MLIPMLTITAVFLGGWLLASVIELWVRANGEPDTATFFRRDISLKSLVLLLLGTKPEKLLSDED